MIEIRPTPISLEDVRNFSAAILLDSDWTDSVVLRDSFSWFIDWLNSIGTADAWNRASAAHRFREEARERRARAWEESRRRMYYTTVPQHTWVSSPFEA